MIQTHESHDCGGGGAAINKMRFSSLITVPLNFRHKLSNYLIVLQRIQILAVGLFSSAVAVFLIITIATLITLLKKLKKNKIPLLMQIHKYIQFSDFRNKKTK
jgi:hypothetical protein